MSYIELPDRRGQRDDRESIAEEGRKDGGSMRMFRSNSAGGVSRKVTLVAYMIKKSLSSRISENIHTNKNM